MAGEPIVTSEAETLEELKARVNDTTCPPLTLAREAKTHLKAFPQSIEQLAIKLGKSRPWLSQLLGFLDLPPDVISKAELENASYRDLQELRAAQVSGKNKTNAANGGANGPANADANAANGPANVANGASVGQNNEPSDANAPANAPSQAYPLLRTTVNTLSRLVFFWAKDPGLGDLAEQWAIRLQMTGWLRVVGILVLWGLAIYGGWHLGRQAWNWAGRQLSTFRTPASPVVGTVLRVEPSPAAAGKIEGISAPQLSGYRWISGHRMELRWTAQAPGTTYRIYWHSPDGDTLEPIGNDVTTPGAIVSGAFVLRPRGFLSVTAINANQDESAASSLVAFDLTPVNNKDWVDPLPVKGAAVPVIAQIKKIAASATSREISGGPPRNDVIAPPTEVHADVKTRDLIRLSWRAVGRDARYNVYSSASSALTSLRKENEQPLKSNTVEWTPETGLERYWIVVTTLDAQGRESAYSEAIEVVRRPDKPDYSAAQDAATGVLRRVLPW